MLLQLFALETGVTYAVAGHSSRYRQGRDLAGKATRRQIHRWDRLPESVGNARTCSVHALLARLYGLGRPVFDSTFYSSTYLLGDILPHVVSFLLLRVFAHLLQSSQDGH